MGPKPVVAQTGELFRQRLDEQINMRQPLERLSGVIDWAHIRAESVLAAICGETYLQTAVPLDASSLTSWRKLIGEAGVKTLLSTPDYFSPIPPE